jgi:hypothetical protein
MVRLIVLLLGVIRAAISSRSNLVLENLALRQQVVALARSRRPRLTAVDRWFWMALRRCWSKWMAGGLRHSRSIRVKRALLYE